MTFNIGPLSISIIQLLILALGIAAALATFNGFAKAWSKLVGILLAIIILIVFLVIAFFKISELTLIPFIAKLVRNHFFDTNKKFQINYDKNDPVDILMKESRSEEEKQVIETKSKTINKKMLSDIESGGLI